MGTAEPEGEKGGNNDDVHDNNKETATTTIEETEATKIKNESKNCNEI